MSPRACRRSPSSTGQDLSDFHQKRLLQNKVHEFSQARILIVDNREENRYVVKRMLESAGYLCEEADRGDLALNIARTIPDLVILDVNLPDMSGNEVCRTLKADPYTESIMVLQVSASFISN